MKKILVYLSIGFSLLGFSIISCQKTSPYLNALASDTTTTVATTNANNVQTANDASNSSETNVSHPGSPAAMLMNRQNLIQDIGTTTSAGIQQNVSFKGDLGDSVEITPQGLHTPGIVHSDFGEGVKFNGRFRKGIIISHFMHKYYEIGFTDTVTFQNYSIDGKTIAGTIILTRLSDSSFKRVCQLSFTLNGGPASTYSSTSTKTYSFHVSATGFVFPVSFTANETGYSTCHNGSNGSLDTATITHPLQYLFSANCMTGGIFPVKGTIVVTSSSLKLPRVIDYGTGTCDLTFTITIGTLVKTITLSSSTK